jgi:hypothetical protein
MRRYNIVNYILLILSVFSFVLAAPVAVQGVREVWADAVDGSDNVIIGSGKRAETQEGDQGSSSASDYASGAHPNPSFSSGESKPPPLTTSGGTELSWNPEGAANLVQPGTSTEVQRVSSSQAKSVKWAPSKEVKLPTGEIYSEMLPPEIEPLPLTEGYQPNQQVSSSKAKLVKWPPLKEVQLPTGEIYSEMLPPEVKPLPLPPRPEGYQPKMAAQQLPSPPVPESETIFSKLVGKLKLWRRIPVTASGV